MTHELALSTDDYSGSFAKIRGRLMDSKGVFLSEFLKTLRPNYGRVFFDIACGYAALVATLVLVGYAQTIGVPFAAAVLLGAILVGYWCNFLISFIHEASHWNLAASRKLNDLIANSLLSWLNGMEVNFYRRVHFEHHRSLGTTADTEYSYFFPLNLKFLLRALFGLRVVETIFSYQAPKEASDSVADKRKSGNKRAFYTTFLLALLAHLSLVASLWWADFTAAALAWVLGVGCAMPTFASVRQILEHRSDQADPSLDYFEIEHGAVTRHFGDGILASTFGSAGFNRHLLHHWEPQVSYTRLGDLEHFLADTPLKLLLDRRRSTYLEALRRLFSLH